MLDASWFSLDPLILKYNNSMLCNTSLALKEILEYLSIERLKFIKNNI